jgi:hypothetical protein
MVITKENSKLDRGYMEEKFNQYLEHCGMDEKEAAFKAGIDAEELRSYIVGDAPERCARCGKEVSVPFVYWSLLGGDIALHGHCAKHLGEELLADAGRVA